MDKTNKLTFFDGVEFVIWGNIAHCNDVQHDRVFDNYYGLQFSANGIMEYAIDDNELIVDNNYPLIITRPHHKYHYAGVNGKSRHHLFLCFRGERVDQWVKAGLLPNEHVIDIVDHELFTLKMIEIINHLNTPGSRYYHKIVNLIEGLLLMANENSQAANRVINAKIRSLITDIQANPQLEWVWEMEAQRLSMSLGHFRRLFKSETGLSPLQYLLELRVQFAANLLIADNNLSISEIAEKSGFEDNFYFSRMFKKHKKFTPSNYRKHFFLKG